MNHRTLGNVGAVSEVGYGAWQIGIDWGDVSESEAVDAAADDPTDATGDDCSLPQLSLRWILDHDAVSTVIPGSTTPEHVRANAAGSDLAPLGEGDRETVADVYDGVVREHVHHRW